MSDRTKAEVFITSATLEIRFMPGIDTGAAARIAGAMLADVKAGAQAQVISVGTTG